jgi:hypothetical protein
MHRWYSQIIAVDVVALVLPTQWLGWRVEFAIALCLLLVTGVLWYRIKFPADDNP